MAVLCSDDTDEWAGWVGGCGGEDRNVVNVTKRKDCNNAGVQVVCTVR